MPRHFLSSTRLWSFWLVLSVIALGTASAKEPGQATEKFLFQESFDDSQLLKRGWYDGDRFRISQTGSHAGAGCLEYEWKTGGTTPASSSGIRRLFPATDTVYLRCYLKLSKGFGWTGRNYHPHLMHFMTTENGPYHGPAGSHLTLYIEPCNGKLRLAAQDIQNKDQPHGLTQGPLKGGYNGQFYDSEQVLFRDDQWHMVEALFQLNTLNTQEDKPNADGIVQGWFDGRLVIDQKDVVLRSTDFPKMKFNQFLLTPYFGPGLLPHAQTLWIDELAVGIKRPDPGNDQNKTGSLFAKENLVAWCIVPFDAKKRTPSQRAEMVKRLGLTKVAYDWRAEHIPQFEEEILEYKKHGLEFFAFWDWHDSIGPLIKQHGIKPQIWRTCSATKQGTDDEMAQSASEALLSLVEKTRELGLKLGLYNHGGWGGEPENLVKVCRYLRDKHQAEHVGIVYNFHHGHDHIPDFANSLKLMQPYLLCVNINGMADAQSLKADPAKKIIPIGSGPQELSLLRILQDSGYQGQIGILDHRPELDAEESLKQNLDGLKKLLPELLK